MQKRMLVLIRILFIQETVFFFLKNKVTTTKKDLHLISSRLI